MIKLLFYLKKSRIYLTHLYDAHGEKNRLRFFLYNKDYDPYIALDDRELAIQIRLQQFPFLKMQKNLILSLEGPLHAPQIRLQNKDCLPFSETM